MQYKQKALQFLIHKAFGKPLYNISVNKLLTYPIERAKNYLSPIKEIVIPTAPTHLAKTDLAVFAVLCCTSNQRSGYHLLYGAGMHAPTRIHDLLVDQPGHALDTNHLYHHTKGFLTEQRARQQAGLNSMIL